MIVAAFIMTFAVGAMAKSYDGEKAWSSINHSILSEKACGWWLLL
jgi:hypothetical protein